jgi:putative tryptophan/tyrosine transport system substrate-binding protein
MTNRKSAHPLRRRGDRIRRRELIVLVGGATLLHALAGRAQEPGRVYRLGIMSGFSREDASFVALFDELRRSGFIEGQNLQVIGRFSKGAEEAPEVAAMLVAAGVDAILTGGGPVTGMMQNATRTIPIVAIADDLMLSGLVSSLAHPGGNTTGISILATELDRKRLELLTQLVPGARHIAALADLSVTAPQQLRAMEEAARTRSFELSIHTATKPEEIVAAIDAAQASGAQALNVLAAPFFDANQRLIIERTTTLKLPAIYQWPEIAEAGGLVAYGPRRTSVWRQRARQLVKIFRGAKPADIPVEQPDTFELVINLQTAKVIGLAVPLALLDRADKVLE